MSTGNLLYTQGDFSGGLNTQYDSTKTPRNSYPLGVDVEMRRNVVAPRRRHVKQTVPSGTKNGLYAVGSQLILFSNGVAYSRDVNTAQYFNRVDGWVDINAAARVYAERIPVTFNLFNRRAPSVEVTTLHFNAALSAYPECVLVGNGTDAEQVIYSDGTAELVGEYDTWTQDNPSYVPIGTVRCFTSDKLFLSSPSGVNLLHSVTGRPTDFVININAAGDKAGDAYTVAAAVSANALTALKAADNGSVIACTAFGTFTVTLDSTFTLFGEPFLRCKPLFPVGAVNDKSFVNLNGDVAFISFTGIHTFNQTKQDRIESQNEPLGRKIRGLLQNPQSLTCAVDFDDNALFAVNTIYGRAVLRYDNSLEEFTSLDLSFGHVRQFAVVNDAVRGPRLFFINESDELYEAHAADEKLAGRIYLGDWTAPAAGLDSRIDQTVVTFTNILAGGLVRCGLWIDGELRGEQTQTVTIDAPPAGNVSLPKNSRLNTKPLTFQFPSNNEGKRVGIMIEWDMDAELLDVGLYGESSPSPAFLGEELDPASAELWFTSGMAPSITLENETAFNTTAGELYAWVPGAVGEKLQVGNIFTSKPTLFTAPGTKAYCTPGASNGFMNMNRAAELVTPTTKDVNLWMLGGLRQTNESFPINYLREMQSLLFRAGKFASVNTIAGPIEANNEVLYYDDCGHSRNFQVTPFSGVEIFSYDPALDEDAAVLTDGYAAGPTKNPDGYDSASVQARTFRQNVENSTAIYKIAVCPLPAYHTALSGGGYVDLRHIGDKVSLVISSAYGATTYERSEYAGTVWLAIPRTHILKMTANSLGLRCNVYEADVLVDAFTIVKPS